MISKGASCSIFFRWMQTERRFAAGDAICCLACAKRRNEKIVVATVHFEMGIEKRRRRRNHVNNVPVVVTK